MDCVLIKLPRTKDAFSIIKRDVVHFNDVRTQLLSHSKPLREFRTGLEQMWRAKCSEW